MKHKFRCSGVKVCEFLDLKLRTVHHEEVSETLWKTMHDYKSQFTLREADPRRQGALKYVASQLSFTTSSQLVTN